MRHLPRVTLLATRPAPAYNRFMRQYERYLFMHLLWPTVIITASLTALVWLTQILKFLDFMVSRGLTLGDFMTLTGLMLPALLFVLVPIAVSIAVIYAYNRLMVESELIVLNAVGVSKWQLAKPALMMGAACMVLCYVLSLVVLPLANGKFQDIRTFFRDKYASVLLEEGVFNTPVEGMTVFVRNRDEANNLSGILLHDSRNPQAVVTMLADTGRMEQTTAGPRFYLNNGMRQQWREGAASWLKFDEYAMDIAFYGKDMSRTRKAEELGIRELFAATGLTNKQAAAYRAEAHHRLAWPLLALSLPAFALAMLFSSEFNRRGQVRRLLLASLGIVAIVLLYFAARSVGVKQAWMASGVYVLVLGVLVISSYLLMSARAVRRHNSGTPVPVAGAL
jgi:lipopolysaccharide export system permease protein